MNSESSSEKEIERLKSLNRYSILDSPQENSFNEIVELASYICNTPISLISFIDDKRQWFKAKKGLDVSETPREYAFCAHAILDDVMFEIEDASKDSRFQDNPLVTGHPDIRFYAGIPLKLSDGYNAGTLCVIDKKANKLNDDQKRALKILANRVVSEMELRLSLQRAKEIDRIQQELIEFKDKLLSIISHDLRSPLASIQSTISLLEGNMINETEIKMISHLLKSEVTNTLQLFENLLNWAKARMGKNELNNKEFLSGQIITNNISLFKSEMKKKNVKIENEDGNVSIMADEEMISLVVRNLLNNSVKFCRSGDTITLGSKQKKDKSIIWIKDTGVGMTSDKLDEMLNHEIIYSQLGTNKEKGFGIGMSLIKEFVKANNGTIMASSEPGVGTEFRIELPSN